MKKNAVLRAEDVMPVSVRSGHGTRKTRSGYSLEIFLVICLAAALFFAPEISFAEPAKPRSSYTFAVVPQAAPEIMHRNWLPFLETLSRETGLTLNLKVYDKMSSFETDLGSGSVDFVYMNPVQAYIAGTTKGYIPLVRGRDPITASLYTRKDSPYQNLGDLKGQSVAFSNAKSVCTIVLTHDARVLQFVPKYVGSPGNVYKLVSIGDAAAGGTLDISMDTDTEAARQGLRPIYTSEPLSPHPIAAHPAVDAKVRQALTETVLRLAKNKDMAPLFKSVRLENPVLANFQADYRPLARLGLREFENSP